jgi:hypothetical protein
MRFLAALLLLCLPAAAVSPVRVARGTATETKESLEMWDGACSLYCAVGPEIIRASSQLKEKGQSYPADQAHDWDLQTAWVEGKPGPGIAEYLEYTYDMTKVANMSKLGITSITVFNGYRKSADLWRANGRVKRMRLSIKGKTKCFVDLQDTPRHANGEAATHPADARQEGRGAVRDRVRVPGHAAPGHRDHRPDV